MAYLRNREELTKELKREKPKKDVVLTLSRQTFFPRRADILSDSLDVCASSLLSEFPELWKPYVVSTFSTFSSLGVMFCFMEMSL